MRNPTPSLALAATAASLLSLSTVAGDWTIDRSFGRSWIYYTYGYTPALVQSAYNYGGGSSNRDYNHPLAKEAYCSVLTLYDQYLDLLYIPLCADVYSSLSPRHQIGLQGVVSSTAARRGDWAASRYPAIPRFDGGESIFDLIGDSRLVDPVATNLARAVARPADGWWSSSLLLEPDGNPAVFAFPTSALSSVAMPFDPADFAFSFPRLAHDVAPDAWQLVPGSRSNASFSALDAFFANVAAAGGDISAWHDWRTNHTAAACLPYLQSIATNFAWQVDWPAFAASRGRSRYFDVNDFAAMSQILAGIDTYVQTGWRTDPDDSVRPLRLQAQTRGTNTTHTIAQPWSADSAIDTTNSYYTVFNPVYNSMQIVFSPPAMRWKAGEELPAQTSTAAITAPGVQADYSAQYSLAGLAWIKAQTNKTFSVSRDTLLDIVRAYGQPTGNADGETMVQWRPAIVGGDLSPVQDTEGGVGLSLDFYSSPSAVATNLSGNIWTVYDFAATGTLHKTWSHYAPSEFALVDRPALAPGAYLPADIDLWSQTVWRSGSDPDPKYYRYLHTAATKLANSGHTWETNALRNVLADVSADAMDVLTGELGFDPATESPMKTPHSMIVTNATESIIMDVVPTLAVNDAGQDYYDYYHFVVTNAANPRLKVAFEFDAFFNPDGSLPTNNVQNFVLTGFSFDGAPIPVSPEIWYEASAGGDITARIDFDYRTGSESRPRLLVEGSFYTWWRDRYDGEVWAFVDWWGDPDNHVRELLIPAITGPGRTPEQLPPLPGYDGTRTITLTTNGVLRVAGVDVSEMSAVPLERLSLAANVDYPLPSMVIGAADRESLSVEADTYIISTSSNYNGDLKINKHDTP